MISLLKFLLLLTFLNAHLFAEEYCESFLGTPDGNHSPITALICDEAQDCGNPAEYCSVRGFSSNHQCCLNFCKETFNPGGVGFKFIEQYWPNYRCYKPNVISAQFSFDPPESNIIKCECCVGTVDDCCVTKDFCQEFPSSVCTSVYPGCCEIDDISYCDFNTHATGAYSGTGTCVCFDNYDCIAGNCHIFPMSCFENFEELTCPSNDVYTHTLSWNNDGCHNETGGDIDFHIECYNGVNWATVAELTLNSDNSPHSYSISIPHIIQNDIVCRIACRNNGHGSQEYGEPFYSGHCDLEDPRPLGVSGTEELINNKLIIYEQTLTWDHCEFTPPYTGDVDYLIEIHGPRSWGELYKVTIQYLQPGPHKFKHSVARLATDTYLYRIRCKKHVDTEYGDPVIISIP